MVIKKASEKELDFIHASKVGDIEAVRELMHDPDLDVNAIDYDGKTALYHACVGINDVADFIKIHPRTHIKIDPRTYREIAKLLIEHPRINGTLVHIHIPTEIYHINNTLNIKALNDVLYYENRELKMELNKRRNRCCHCDKHPLHQLQSDR